MIKLTARNTKGDLIFLEYHPNQKAMYERIIILNRIFTGLKFKFRYIHE